MSSEELLRLEHLSKDFPGVKALSDVTLGVLKGEVHALVGENGAGKSTLIKTLAGVEFPNPGGKIIMEGQEVQFSDALSSCAAGISVIFQDFSLFPNLTIAENICFSYMTTTNHKIVNQKQIVKIAQEALDEIKLDVDVFLPAEKLSIAKQQMVAIARALALKAKLVIMDEPTSTLSSSEVEHLFRIIQELKAQGITTIFISHKLDEVFTIADRISVLRDGQMVGTFEKNQLDEQKLIAHMVGRELKETSRTPCIQDQVVLEVRHLSKKKNFKDISFRVHKGEVVSLTGLVGSGRSEVATTLFGIQHADSGDVLIDGEKIDIKSPAQTKKLGLALVPESRQTEGLIMRQDVKSNITATVMDRIQTKFGLISDTRERQEAERLIEQLDVRPRYPDILVQNLSGGNQQKVVLAKWLATNPRLLIVDEPTNGVDIGAKSEIYKLIRSLAQQGMAILMISSELSEVFAVSDTVLVMRNGRLVAQMNIGETSQEQIMRYALTGKPMKSSESEVLTR